MSTPPSPQALFEEGRAALPVWGEPDPGGARHQRATELLYRAAELGHLEAMEMLAHDLEPGREGAWSIALARRGNTGPLVSNLVNSDLPPAFGLGVLAAARAGEAWAMLAVGQVYGMGMCLSDTGVLVATLDGAWGWLPGVPDPEAEAAVWTGKARATGWAPALLHAAGQLRFEDPAGALALVREALGDPDGLVPRDRDYARRLCAELAERAGVSLEERIGLWRALAESGDADAMARLGDLHRKGDGLPKDLAAARAWYTRAADGGSVAGCRELGKMLEKGKGGPVDEAGAIERFQAAAELGADRYSRDRLARRFGQTWYARRKGE